MSSSRSEPLIEFIPSKETVTQTNYLKNSQSRRKTDLKGDDVRNFYEGLVSEKTKTTLESAEQRGKCESLQKLNSKEKRSGRFRDLRHKTDSSKKRSYSGPKNYPRGEHCEDKLERSKTELLLFKSCQDGNVDSVLDCINKGADFDVQDQYGWTPLMCSAYAGHNKAVSLLMKCGADWTVCEKRGKTACDLALQGGHQDTVKLINDMVGQNYAEISDSESKKQDKGFYCDVCKKRFTVGSFKSHVSSTVHLFNRQLKPAQPSYLITESNVGYQMMLRSGWDTSHGLGPRGEGHKYPVKTVLKRDREGLGRERTSSPRVTHFKPRDVEAVKSVKPRGGRIETRRTVSRRAMRRRERRDREWERRLRQYMNSD